MPRCFPTRTISLIGIDGAGKTVQASLLAKFFSKSGFTPRILSIRGSGSVVLVYPLILLSNRTLMSARSRKGEGIGDIVRELDLYLPVSLRAGTVGLLIAILIGLYSTLVGLLQVRFMLTLNRRSIVLTDRFLLDVLVDLMASFKRVKYGSFIYWWVASKGRVDEVIYLEVDPIIALQRKDNVQGEDYLRKRALLYTKLARELKLKQVDANLDVHTVHQRIIESLGRRSHFNK